MGQGRQGAALLFTRVPEIARLSLVGLKMRIQARGIEESLTAVTTRETHPTIVELFTEFYTMCSKVRFKCSLGLEAGRVAIVIIAENAFVRSVGTHQLGTFLFFIKETVFCPKARHDFIRLRRKDLLFFICRKSEVGSSACS